MTAEWGAGAPDVDRTGDHQIGFRQMVEFSTDGYLATDAQGVVIEANQTAANVLQCAKEFLIGKPLGLLVAKSHRNRFYQCLSRLHGGARSDEFDSRVGRRGEIRDVAVRVVVVDDGNYDGLLFRWQVRDVTLRRKAEAARDNLLLRLVTVQEEERQRIALELHDSVGQLLSVLLLRIRAVRDAGPLPPAASARLDEVQRLADELGRTTHNLAYRLRPSALDDVGLRVALRHYLEDWSAQTGVEARFEAVGGDSQRFPREVETALYRVTQEALTNVFKHAEARQVSVVVESQDGRAIAVIEDNGIGFDPDTAFSPRRLGLLGMRERLALLGGDLVVESSPGAGTTVIARIPLPL